ncbi:MAG: DUF2341 domain-containing protein, partial [Candidatus Omnitrophota bacterium]
INGAGGTWTLPANTAVAEALTVSAGTFDSDTNDYTVTVTGLATVSGGTYLASSSAAQTFNGGLTISGGTFTGSGGVVDINGDLIISGGACSAPTGTLTISGNWLQTGGTFAHNSGTVNFDGTGAQTLEFIDGFYNLTHSGAGTLNVALWYSADWTYRKTIIISKSVVSGGSDLTDFPLLIKFSADADIAAHAKSDGSDIRIASGDGNTLLSREIEKYDNATGELWVWVKVPTLSASVNTVLYLYYGNAAAAAPVDDAQVWDANYVGVWHLNDDAANTNVNESTSNGNDGTAQQNTEDLTTTGQDDGALTFNGTSDYISLGNEIIPNGSTTWSFAAWVNLDTLANADSWDGRNVYYEATSGGINWTKYSVNIDSGGHLWSGYRDTETGAFINFGDSTNTITSGTWYYLSVTVDTVNDIACYYVNGALSDSPTFAGDAIITSGTRTRLGWAQDAPYTGKLDGTLDEVRVSDTTRSTDWIATEYNNQSAPATYQNALAEMTTSSTALPIAGTFTNSGGEFNANGRNMTVTGNFANSATFTPGTNTVTFNGVTPNTQTLDIGASSLYGMAHSGTGTLQLTGNDLTVTNSIDLSAGTFDLNGMNLTTNGATFTVANATLKLQGDETIGTVAPTLGSGSTVEYTATSGSRAIKDWDYTNATISFTGAGTFVFGEDHTFTAISDTAAGSTLTFTAGMEQTVTDDITITGSSSNPIIINDNGAGATPKLSVQAGATQAITNVSVTNNDASGGVTLVARGSGSSLHGVTTNWVLGPVGTTFTWTGAVSTNWNAAGNWDVGLVPSDADNVIIPSGTPNDPHLAAATTIETLQLNSGASMFTDGFAFGVLQGAVVDGALDAGSSAVTVGGNLTTASAGRILGTDTYFSVSGYAGTRANPISTTITGTLTIHAGGMNDYSSIVLSGTGKVNFRETMPGFVFMNGLQPSVGQGNFRALLDSADKDLNQPMQNIGRGGLNLPYLEGLGYIGGGLPGYGMAAPMMVATPAGPVMAPAPMIAPMPVVAPVVLPAPAVTEKIEGSRLGPQYDSGLARTVRGAYGAHMLPPVPSFIGAAGQAGLPHPVPSFEQVTAQTILPPPRSEYLDRSHLGGDFAAAPAPSFAGARPSVEFKSALTKENFENAIALVVLPELRPRPSFEGATARIVLPAPLPIEKMGQSPPPSYQGPGTVPIFSPRPSFEGAGGASAVPDRFSLDAFKGVFYITELPERPSFEGATARTVLPAPVAAPVAARAKEEAGRYLDKSSVSTLSSSKGREGSRLGPKYDTGLARTGIGEYDAGLARTVSEGPGTVPIFSAVPIGEARMPSAPSFEGVTSAASLPKASVFEGIAGAASLPKAPTFEEIRVSASLTGKGGVGRFREASAAVSLEFPGGGKIIPTYNIGVPLGAEKPLLEPKVKREKE